MSFRLTKIVTKKGDQGMTGLAGGERVSKASPRIEAHGAVDELNSILGLARAVADTEAPEAIKKEIHTFLARVQNELFDLGGNLSFASPGKRPHPTPDQAGRVRELETEIEHWQKALTPLQEFILPGGGVVASHIHLARTVCRRAERAIVALAAKESVDPAAIPYLNRLGDALFVLARWIAVRSGEPEILWDRKKKQAPV